MSIHFFGSMACLNVNCSIEFGVVVVFHRGRCWKCNFSRLQSRVFIEPKRDLPMISYDFPSAEPKKSCQLSVWWNAPNTPRSLTRMAEAGLYFYCTCSECMKNRIVHNLLRFTSWNLKRKNMCNSRSLYPAANSSLSISCVSWFAMPKMTEINKSVNVAGLLSSIEPAEKRNDVKQIVQVFKKYTKDIHVWGDTIIGAGRMLYQSKSQKPYTLLGVSFKMHVTFWNLPWICCACFWYKI